MKEDLLGREVDLRRLRRRYCNATIVWSRPPTSGRPGDRALVTEDGVLHGWVGGSCAEPVVVRESLRALAEGAPRILCLAPGDSMAPARPGVVTVTVTCASEGEMEIFIEPHVPAPHVMLVGNAPLVTALAEMARAIEYDVDVVDVADLSVAGPGSYVVVATFGRYDEDAVAAALEAGVEYVALVASAKRAATVLEALRATGVTAEGLARVRAPAGLDLGSLRHLEIAAAVLADVVAVEALRRQSAPRPKPVAVAMTSVIDPVCGMTVQPVMATVTASYDGVDFWFCSSGCRRRFEAAPTDFVT